jgi:hypothetical protein
MKDAGRLSGFVVGRAIGEEEASWPLVGGDEWSA